jgi:glycerol-1-phosphate dehydrogenase [NAD(P)+]
MFEETIEQLLNGRYPDPDGGPDIGVDCRAVVISDSLAGAEADLIGSLGFGPDLALVMDENTCEALGARVRQSIEPCFSVLPVVLSGRPRADLETVERLRGSTGRADAVIVVGSGAITDLCKYAAFLDGKPYAVFPTAPSMNGYTSANAAITVDGHKKSLAAVMPRGVFIDLTVLADAPKRMILSGLGDSICRSTAQADWLLSHLLFDTFYRTAPFQLLAPYEEELLRNAFSLVRGDLASMRLLACTLVMSGFGMTICNGSYPASQGEHLISHYIEMMAGEGLPESFHGEQIGVTTLTMAVLQERMLALESLQIRPTEVTEEDVKSHFGAHLGAACWQEFQAKRLDADGAADLQRTIDTRWDEIRARLKSVTRSSAELQTALKQAGCPLRPADLSWPDDFYRSAVVHSREIRNRYTFLDLAGDADLFHLAL